MFKKLRNHMMLFNMLTVSLVMLAAFAVIYLVTYSNIQRENTQKLQAVSAMFFMPNRTPPDSEEFGAIPEPSQAQERFSVDYGVSFVLFIKNGKLENVNSQLDFEDSVYTEAFEKAGTADSGKITLGDRKWLFIVEPTPAREKNWSAFSSYSEYKRIVFLDITNGVRLLRTLLVTLACVGSGVLLALFWLSCRFAARAVQPIEESYNKQKQFVADASHELRTPIAIISANIDAIESSSQESVESQKEWFGYIRSELKRTGKLVEDLLYLAKAENAGPDGNIPFDLSLVLETACASMEAMLYECGITLDTRIENNIFVSADSGKIMQVLYILLDNAGKYTPRGGHIRVFLRREHERGVIRIANEGAEIASEDLLKIFDRFYRPDLSRSQKTGGFGLGLSIAKTIVERSGGEIFAESTKEITTFTVKLKLV